MLNDIAREIVGARRERRALDATFEISTFDKLSLDEAYEVQRNIIATSSEKVIGWKLGGTNEMTRQKFNVNELYWGPILAKRFHTDDEQVALSRGEVELAFQFDGGVEGINGRLECDGLIKVIDKMCLSVEFPWTTINNLDKEGVVALIADCCAAGTAVLGKPVKFEPLLVQAAEVRVRKNGEKVESGNESLLLGGVLQTLCDFINASRDKGFHLQAGQWIFTGGLTSCYQYTSGDDVKIESDSLPWCKFKV